jgi:hypothetical protein
MNLKSKTQKNYRSEDNKSNRIFKLKLLTIAIFSMLILTSQKTYAHCDSYDGPTIKDAIEALETNNVNLVLKWISHEQEQEIIPLFNKTYSLKKGDKEVYNIVEKHFFETLIRLHRETEGAPFTGLKPAGTTKKIILLSDNAITNGDFEDLFGKLNTHIKKVLIEKYKTVFSLQKLKNESIEKGREYVAAYVDYTHTLEAIHDIIEHGSGHSGHNH